MNVSDQKQNGHQEQTFDEMNILIAQYQLLSNREINHDSLLWDTPTLLLVAQTLLWSIALDDSVSLIFRLVTSLSGISVSFMSFQLFLKHRVMEVADAEQLYSIEKFFVEHSDPSLRPLIIHHRLRQRTLFSEENRLVMDELERKQLFSKIPLAKLSSFLIWELAFWMFLAISFLIFLFNIYSVLTYYT